MNRSTFTKSILVAWLVLVPAWASAQSAIAGQVRDTTGAVLPGVTVEASSPVLIEKVRTVVTDDQGRYTIVDLRPGTYAVTFSLTGFAAVKREGIELPANVTAPVNAELKVGALEETVTVSGQTPVVDIQSAQRTQVLTREIIDALPTSRAVTSFGAVIPGIRLTKPDLGGASSMQQSYGMAHGAGINENGMQVDGMNVKPNNDIQGTQAYQNPAMAQEVSYQTSAVGAETASGGIRINMIPREGGNTFKGEIFFTGADGSWQSNNITPELKARGLATPDHIEHMYDVNPAFGGPIKRDRLWFFASARRNVVNRMPAGAFYKDGRPAVEDQYVNNASLRLTWQASVRNKITLYKDRAWKFKGHDFTDTVLAGGGTPGGIDPETGAGRREPKVYYIGQAKWTSTVSNKLLLENGLSMSLYNRTTGTQKGIIKPRGTPEWYAGAQRFDFIRGTQWASSGNQTTTEEAGYLLSSAVSYVTGSHNFKTGLQWKFGPKADKITGNADLRQRYRDGVPEEIEVFTTPVYNREYVKAEAGIYVQDSWALKRLTINPGVRFEYFNTEIQETSVGPGRFVPARHVDHVPDLPNWKDVAPRFSVVYDLFGNATTALKASANKYMKTWSTGVAHRYNPMILDIDRRDWRDLNGDDIAQDNEIGPSNNRNFGIARSRNPAPSLEREYNIEYSAGVQHELMPQVSIIGAWYRRNYRNLEKQDNLLVDVSDYTSFQVPNPLSNGEILTLYNLKREKQGLVDILDTNSRINGRTYTGFEFSFMARLPRGGTAFGGWTAERTVLVTCDTDDPNKFRFCDQRGKLYQELGGSAKIPFRSEFKLAGSYSLPLGVQLGASLISYPGITVGNTLPDDPSLNVLWLVPASLFPGGRTQSVTVPLISPGTKFLKRWNQLDAGVKKSFRVRGTQVQGQVDVYNLLNSSVVLKEIENFGPTLGKPATTLDGRLIKLGARVAF